MSNLKLNKLLNSSKNKTNKNTKKKKKIVLPSPSLVIIPIVSATIKIQWTKESSSSNVSITRKNNQTEISKIVEKKINVTVENIWMKNIYSPILCDIRSSVSVKSIIEAKVTCFRSNDTPSDEQEQKSSQFYFFSVQFWIQFNSADLSTSTRTDKNAIVISGIITCKDCYKNKARHANNC